MMQLIIGPAINTLFTAADTFSLLKSSIEFVKEKRLKNFINILSREIDQLSAKEKRNLQNFLEEEEGRAMLVDHLDKALSTPSDIAIIALAILIAHKPIYSEDFIFIANNALHGINDQLVSIFLEIFKHQEDHIFSRDEHQHYPIVMVNDNLLQSMNDTVRPKLENPESRSLILHQLVNRGLFLADVPGARLGGEEFSVPLGISDSSRKMNSLLLVAKSIIDRG